jgi:hypothetical protein
MSVTPAKAAQVSSMQHKSAKAANAVQVNESSTSRQTQHKSAQADQRQLNAAQVSESSTSQLNAAQVGSGSTG